MSAPPNAPVTVCDLANTAIYELAPEAMRVQVTDVDSFRNPVTGAELVQMSMTAASASQFGRFTAGLVGEQIAFVRNGMVVWGPKITAPIDGQVLQLSGELTEQQAQQIARILRDGN
jgi:preprotein translocase subunit SecD